MRNWVYFLLIIAVFSSCAQKKAVILSDPVFAVLFEAGEQRELNRYLSSAGLALEINNVGFSGPAETGGWNAYISGADLVFYSPGLIFMENQIIAAAGETPVYPLEIRNDLHSSYENTIELLKTRDSLRGNQTAVIMHSMYKAGFEEEISVMGWDIPGRFYWTDDASEDEFDLWLDSLGDVTAAVFISEGVPLSVLTEILEKKEISTLVHDIVETSFIEEASRRSMRTRLYTGPDMGSLVLRELEAIYQHTISN